MSISNTVTKVEEFAFDNASVKTIDNELENHHPQKAKRLRVKNLTRAVKA